MSFEGDPTNRIEGLSPQSQSAMIGIMQGLISGVGFGNVYIESGENSPPVARVGFSMADQSMARYMQIPDFNDELVLLTINEQYRVKGLHPDVFIYGRQFIASDGEVYDIKAKKIGAEQFLYTVNEVVQDVDPLTGLGTSHSLKKKLKEIEVNIDRRLGDRERRREKRLKGTSSKTDELINLAIAKVIR